MSWEIKAISISQSCEYPATPDSIPMNDLGCIYFTDNYWRIAFVSNGKYRQWLDLTCDLKPMAICINKVSEKRTNHIIFSATRSV